MGYLNEDGLTTLVGKIKGQVVQLTSAEYRLLPESKNSDNKIYFVTDEDYAYAIDNEPTANSENLVKSGGVYNYTSKIGSGTLTTTAQTIIPAINELKNGLMKYTDQRLTASNLTFELRGAWYRANVTLSTITNKNVVFVQSIGWTGTNRPVLAQLDSMGTVLQLIADSAVTSGSIDVRLFYI